MIFVTVGSQKFQFNRLLKYLDELVEKQIITDEIFAQIGFCDYKPHNFTFKDFLDRDEFIKKVSESELVITHGGTGSIMGAVKLGKKVIAVPRLHEFDEHVDNHQEQIIKQLMDEKIIMGVLKLEELENILKEINTFCVINYESNTNAIIDSIEKYILEMKKK